MNIIDLTHLIHQDMPVYPGTEPATIKQVSILEREGYRELNIHINSHTGTHIDAPGHILDQGIYLDKMDPELFIGRAAILGFTAHKTNLITLNKLKLYQEIIEKVEFVILKTRWSQYWGNEQYYKNYPYLSKEAAKWLSGYNLKGIGVDTISIDGSNSKDFINHKTLLSKNMIIIENMTNLDSIQKKYFILSVLPLKIKDSDGSPVRAIAILNR